MSLIPKTTCGRCHRQYPALRGRCPYCGEAKPREARRTVPEADSAVRGTAASARADENLNWQMLIGTILVIAVLTVVIVIVSVGVKNNPVESVDEVPGQTQQGEETQNDPLNAPAVAATAVPTPTTAPTAAPTPTPQVISLAITFLGNDMEGFTEDVGDEIQLDAYPYPLNSGATVNWSSTDEDVAVVDETGLVTLVGEGNCYIIAEAAGVEDKCQVISLIR